MDRAESESASVVATHSGQLAFPLDILLLIVQDLDIQDILTLGQVRHAHRIKSNTVSTVLSVLQTPLLPYERPLSLACNSPNSHYR